MNIQGLNLANSLSNFTSGELREGQRLFVEVLHLDPSGHGVVNIKGNLLDAVLETAAQPGEKFWAVVKEVGTQQLVFAREVKTPGSLQTSGGLTEFTALDQDLAQALNTAKNLDWNTLLAKFAPQLTEEPSLTASKHLTGFGEQHTSDLGAKLSLELVERPLSGQAGQAQPGLFAEQPLPKSAEQQTPSLAEKLFAILPRWPELNGDNGQVQIREFLNKLGIGYERKLAELLLSKDKPPEEEIARMKDTIKAQLLEGLNDQGDHSLSSKLQGLLEKITGQQLILGDLNNSYVWLSLPLKDNQRIHDAKIALQSDRHKNVLDQAHCRIGVYMETEALGKIGIDAYLSENTLSLRVLTTNSQDISILLQEFKEETIARFAHLGLKLTGIDIAPLDTNSDFNHFVSGGPRQGVDIYA